MAERISDRLLSWAPAAELEPQALRQAENLSRMPFIHGHVALMPDCHLGKGATVGSVIATRGAIIPAAVGVDIGCGMIAARTNLTASDLPDSLDPMRAAIEDAIPTGIGERGRNRRITPTAETRLGTLKQAATTDYAQVDGSWGVQLGSLGGGNHFIEVCLDEADRVWFVLHSGSRGIGNKLAERHMKVADALMKLGKIELADPDLAYLLENTPEFDAYVRDLLWAQSFARLNRDEMMDRVFAVVQAFVPLEELDRINCHHNFTQRELHGDAEVWLTRKGAIQMRTGQRGVIPGSMGTRSYVVRGLGNRHAFESAPHGAGRRMSRAAARKRFTVEDLEARMEGIACRVRPSVIDEHPDSYKDIDRVMELSKDLVVIEHTLRQVVNVKGD